MNPSFSKCSDRCSDMWPTLVCFCCAIDAICVIKISIFMVDGKIFAEHTCPYFLSWFSYESVSI
ncbi:hypothetical protein PAHAL_J026700 [Panicum hallii]|uniref:Uncharacterized protein n=1 Tax=Panicum hallii TaxID=206008 RepID=A0A2T7AA38_9POAL|nr:hypothetical protein PAHAL_J026700 [Panicum hallii]